MSARSQALNSQLGVSNSPLTVKFSNRDMSALSMAKKNLSHCVDLKTTVTMKDSSLKFLKDGVSATGGYFVHHCLSGLANT